MLRVIVLSVVSVLLSFASESRAGDSDLVSQIRSELQSNPGQAVDRLNGSLMAELLKHEQYAAVEQLAITGTLALPADTWRIEQLQKHRIRALLAEHKTQEALRAAKSLFNVCGMGFAKEVLPLLCDCLAAAHPEDRSIVPRFKLQVLAAAQEDPTERERLSVKYGGNSIMNSIDADPDPYATAIASRRAVTEWRGLYGTGNLLLMSGRIKEARVVFTRVYNEAPPGELRYASEGIAKLIKAEDDGLGRANEFVLSIKPQQ